MSSASSALQRCSASHSRSTYVLGPNPELSILRLFLLPCRLFSELNMAMSFDVQKCVFQTANASALRCRSRSVQAKLDVTSNPSIISASVFFQSYFLDSVMEFKVQLVQLHVLLPLICIPKMTIVVVTCHERIICGHKHSLFICGS